MTDMKSKIAKCAAAIALIALAYAPSPALSYGKCVQDAVLAVGYMSEMHPGDQAWRNAWNDLDFRREIYRQMARCNAPEATWRRVLGVLNETYSDDTPQVRKNKARMATAIQMFLSGSLLGN